MISRQHFRLAVVIAALATAARLVAAPQQPAPAAQTGARTAALTQAIPVDPQITVGRLDNGLRYYIRANKRPQNRAELRLVVNAGSILEDDDQRGLAHFVEHMAFNGTKNFPKQDITTFMQSIGMRFGAHVNAYTSFDETVFMLTIPVDKPEVVDRAFLILEDWAHNVTFDPVEIDKERGVVIEEWRLGRGAQARLQEKQFPILLQGSRYAERLPIGKVEILQNFKPARLTKFYADWYRPDLMAVVAVGDFDKSSIEARIKQHFAALPKATVPRVRPSYDVPEHPGTLYAIATDREATTTSVQVYHKLPLHDGTTVGAYRQEVVDRLFGEMLSARFDELSQKPDAPFLGAFAGKGLFVRTKEAAILTALVTETGIERGLEAVFAEAERVARYGFTATELDRVRQNTLRTYEQLLAEKDNHESGTLAAEYIRNFLQREPIPGIAYEYDLQQRFLPTITLAEMNKLAKEWAPDRSRVVVVSAPQKDGVAMPDQAKLAGVIKGVSSMNLKPYVDTVTGGSLLDATPAPGAIAKTSTRDAQGITEWELSNGIKVVLKPTNFKEDEILFRATSPGGYSLASDADFIPAETASEVVGAGGLGKFSMVDLQKALAGKVVRVNAGISETEESVSGSASRKDLETMFQLIYLTFTQPRPDPAMFYVITSQMKAFLANQTNTPEFAFGEMLRSTLSQNHPRARSMTPALIDEWNLDKSMAFYKDRFADASDFTFVFVGSFEPAALKPLVEQYLASLPATRRRESWKDVGIRPPKGVIEKEVDKGLEPKSRARIVFTGPFEWNQTQRVAIRAMAQVLQGRLRDSLREELGGTYSVTSSAGYQKIPREEYSFTIDFGCDPQRTNDLLKRVFAEIDALKKNGATDKEVNDIREQMLRDFETSSRQNGYLLGQIALKYQYGEDVAGLWEIPNYYRKLDAAAIQQAARTYLDTNNYVKVTLFPEKK